MGGREAPHPDLGAGDMHEPSGALRIALVEDTWGWMTGGGRGAWEEEGDRRGLDGPRLPSAGCTLGKRSIGFD